MAIVQLRGTIFAPLSIVYTPENFTTFSEMLLPGAKAYAANPPEMMPPGVNPHLPQYGLPWRLFKKEKDEGEYNIVFLPGKLDIILTKDVEYGDDIEKKFCNLCIDWFAKILSSQGSITVNRIAYAPLYAIKLININSDSVWGSFLKRTVLDGTPIQDVNYNFLLKRETLFDDLKIQMNFLHNFSDGIQIRQAENKIQKVVLFQLDMNSIPEIPLTLNSTGVKKFFDGILKVKNSLVDNVIE